jgi:hypothetical protein
MGELYKAVCHTKCYWLETLWQVGEIYEGKIKPIKHFSSDGKIDKPVPPPNPGDDKRSNKEIRDTLRDKYGSTKPMSWSRKKLWAAIHEFETARDKDELTSPGKKHNITADTAKKAK